MSVDPSERARLWELIFAYIEAWDWECTTDVQEKAVNDFVDTLLHEERERCARVAEDYFLPCDDPADISARECGEQIAAAIRRG